MGPFKDHVSAYKAALLRAKMQRNPLLLVTGKIKFSTINWLSCALEAPHIFDGSLTATGTRHLPLTVILFPRSLPAFSIPGSVLLFLLCSTGCSSYYWIGYLSSACSLDPTTLPSHPMVDSINKSKETGVAPTNFKTAAVSPILKILTWTLITWKEQSLSNFGITCLSINSLNPSNLVLKQTTPKTALSYDHNDFLITLDLSETLNTASCPSWPAIQLFWPHWLSAVFTPAFRMQYVTWTPTSFSAPVSQ